MNNLQASRRGFRFKHTLSTDGAKRKVVIFEVIYLKSTRGDKGVRVSMRPSEVEQCDGYRSESTPLYNKANISTWARMVARKSDKAVLEVAEKLDPKVSEIIAAYLDSPAKGREALVAIIGGGL
jgi:hypothetical protein